MIGELAALTAAAVWAVAAILWARLGKDVDAVVLNALKCGIATVLLSGTLFLLEGTFWPMGLQGWDLVWLSLSAIAGLTFGDSAYFNALVRIGPRRTLLLWSLTPAITALLGWPVLGEVVGAQVWFGMALTLGGIAWVVSERSPAEEGEPGKPTRVLLVGVGFGLLAALGQATANVLIKLGGGDLEGLGVAVVRLAVGTFGLGIMLGGLGRLAQTLVPMKAPRKAGLIVVATLIGTYLGIWLNAIGLLKADVAVASTLNSTSPLFILPLAHFAGGDKVTARAIAGAVVAVVGVAVLFG